MTILYCIPHLFRQGGMERVLTQKLNWLAGHTDYRLLVATTESTPQGMPIAHFPLDERVEVRELNINFDAEFGAPLPYKLWQHIRKQRIYQKALEQLIREQGVDICVSLCGKEIAFLSALPCRTMAEIHFSKNERQLRIEAYHTGWLWTLLGKLRNQALLHDVKRLKRFVCLTQADLQAWQQSGCKHAQCIPNPCGVLPAEPGSVGTDKPISHAERKKTVIGVGRLHPQKGFDRLLEAWQYVEKKHPDWALEIAGEGPEHSRLTQLIKDLQLKKATLVGAQTDMFRVYSSASLLAMSSRYEGLPLALIEAMWCGTPCVSFDCPQGPAELISPERGILVPNNDIQGLAEAICTLIEDEQRRLQAAEKSYDYAHQHFAEDVIMQQWLSLFRDLTI